jgi:hypothetical protein
MRLVGQAMKGLKDSGLGGRLVELYGPGSPPVINQFDTSYWGTGLYLGRVSESVSLCQGKT